MSIYEIKNRFTGKTIYKDDAESFSALVSAAIRAYANLRGADLQGANLQSANLRYANLRGVNLRSVDLQSANLRSVDLQSADLQSANLQFANLQFANLRYADLRGADLQSADLRYADLQGADLPAPTMILLAAWGEVSESLTADLMLLDASAHPDVEKFKQWVDGGPCPYQGVKVQRIANFKENKSLWGKGKPDTIYNLILRILAEKTRQS